MPEINHNSEEDLTPDTEDEPISVEEGDQILATGLLPTPTMDICASSTISQRLAEAFQANRGSDSDPRISQRIHLHVFKAVF